MRIVPHPHELAQHLASDYVRRLFWSAVECLRQPYHDQYISRYGTLSCKSHRLSVAVVYGDGRQLFESHRRAHTPHMLIYELITQLYRDKGFQTYRELVLSGLTEHAI